MASWLSPACPPSHCPHANREAQQPASAFGFWRPHLQPSWPSSLPLTASPEVHQLGHFPTDTGASKWPGRMCLFADSWQPTGPPLQLLAGVAVHCLCSLNPHARVGLLGACGDGEAGTRNPVTEGFPSRVEDLPAHPENKSARLWGQPGETLGRLRGCMANREPG